jgi:predicted secreted protein
MPPPLAPVHVLALLLAFGGCSGAGLDRGGPLASSVVTVAVTERGGAEPSAVRLAVGDTLRIEAVERPGTGFRWEVDPLEASPWVRLPDPPTEEQGGPVLGGEETRTLLFRAARAGRADLRLSYAQPWAPDAAAARASIAVTVE